MRIGLKLLAVALLLFGCTKGCQKSGGRQNAEHPSQPERVKVVSEASRRTLQAFRSEAELGEFLRELAKAGERDRAAQSQLYESGAGAAKAAAPAPAASAAPGAESVTSTQHAGVGEGGIVNLHGDHLIVLRRGRLFSVRVGDDSLTPVAGVDAFGPDVDPDGTWYDEMLVAGNTIAVIGYSYSRGGTEVGLFDIDAAGAIAYRATYHLRSNDYFSSRNYASRLIGDKLVFYTPLHLALGSDDPTRGLPALRRWRRGATDEDWRSIVSAARVYRPLTSSPDLTLHTVTVCDLGRRDFDCTARAVFGPHGRVFYVSPSAVYVWTTEEPRSIVYRLPLDGAAPTALRADGNPVDQFSFLEGADGFLNVLVRSEAHGDGMWGAELASGEVALLRAPIASFGGGADGVTRSDYTPLPRPEGSTFQNRFVGRHVLYGAGSGWGRPNGGAGGTVYAYRYGSQSAPSALPLPHGVDRIEALGSDAVIVGTDGTNLHFSALALGDHVALGGRYTRPNATQGELRSHGFFYKPEGERRGLLGLPVRGEGRPGFEHLTEGSASIVYLKHQDLRLWPLGELEPRATTGDDRCRASCVDWYGNARPLFLRGRVFALLGYELVEGRELGGRVVERRRVSFAPGQLAMAR